MQPACFVRALRLLLALGVVLPAVGCGSVTNQGSATDEMAAAKANTAELRQFFEKRKAEGAAAKGAPVSRGKSRANSGS